MKHILITIAAVVLVGCGQSQQSAPQAKPVETVDEASQPEPTAADADDISIQVTSNPEADQALWQAVWEDDIKSIKQALNDGADVNATDDLVGWTPLDEAINQKHTETAELLHKHGGKTGEEIADKMAKRSIHVAARVGDIDWVIKHLEYVTDVNAQDDDSWTPLHWSAGRGNKEIAELLIATVADVNAKDVDGSTPLDLAKLYEGDSPEDKAARMEIADLLRKHGAKTG